jgi:hypothetical protein
MQVILLVNFVSENYMEEGCKGRRQKAEGIEDVN